LFGTGFVNIAGVVIEKMWAYRRNPDQISVRMIKTLVFLFEEISKTRFPREKVLSAT
jgi:hypothetical protein